MRLLVACTECERQYDASGRKIGSRFRCHCGEVVSVEAPAGHDAHVIRCSGCGAPREKGNLRCEFCRADFTLHERDLHTVCPTCMTRVSDRAKFCHSCGGQLSIEMTVDEITEMSCPACGEKAKLVSRALGTNKTTVMECQRCVGLWLSKVMFSRITAEAAKQASNTPQTALSGKAKKSFNPPQANFQRRAYRPCVVCSKLMHRTQYSHGSGVIIDICRRHGTWFDAQELPQILAWLRSGGPAEMRESEKRKSGEHLSDATNWELAKRKAETGSHRSGSWSLEDDAFHLLRDLFGL